MHRNTFMPSWDGYDPDKAWAEMKDFASQMEEISDEYEALENSDDATYMDAENFLDRMEELQEQHDLVQARLTVWLLGGGWRPAGMPAPEIVVKPNSAPAGNRILNLDDQWADIVRLEATLEALNATDPDGDDIENIRSCEELGDQVRDRKAALLDQLAVGAPPPTAGSAGI